MPFLEELTLLAAKIESVEGTAETLQNTDTVLIINPKFSQKIEINKRPIVGGDLSQYKSLPGRRSSELSFDVSLKGSGTAGTAPEWGKLMKACGFAETVVPVASVSYLPASSGVPSMTLALYMNGIITKMWGARGTVALDLTGGQYGKLSFKFTGADFSVVDGAMLTGMSYDTTFPPEFASAAFTIDGYAAIIEKLLLDINNSVKLRPDVNKSSGYVSALIANREPKGSIDPEFVTVATYDFFGKLRSGAEGALSTVLGATAGNIITVTAPKCQYTDVPINARNNIRTLGVNFQLNRNSGNDELSIALT